MQNYKNEIKATFKLAYPVIIGQVGHIMIGVADSVMVGHVGVVPLAAAALANRLFVLIMVIGMGMTMALTPLVAEAIGAKSPEQCGKVLQQGMAISTIMGFILAITVIAMADTIPYLHQPPEVAQSAMSYLVILGASIIPFMLFQAFRQFSEGLSLMWPAMILNIAANIWHIFLNWVFIYGHLGFPAMGLDGAGFSTLITRSVMAFALIAYIMKSRHYKPFLSAVFPIKIDWKTIRTIFAIGTGSGLQYFFESGAFAGSVILMGWLGEVPLAAHQIAMNAIAITYMFGMGVSAAAAVRVGNAKGEQNLTGMRQAGFSAFLLSACIMLGFGVLFILFSHIIPRFYTTDQPVIEVAASLLIVAAFFQVSDGVQVVGLGVLRGMADVKIPTVITFISYWIIGLPAGYLLAFPLGFRAAGIWAGLLMGLTASALLLFYRFHKKTQFE
ncbi:MAG TPA: MATE family efflux transporter [Candidatus Deferrimicrobium sp.]|nr:MATE family efflux transporter [Candidatus Deferrimicrobium sp.]